MQPPQVRDLQAVIGQIGQSVIPMKQQIDADIAANEQYGTAQLAGLEAKKVKGFQQIDQNAQNKNMFFSGLSADDQAEYLSDTYLPAVAQLQNTIATTRSGLLKEKLGLDQNVFDKSWTAVEGDRAVLADWNKMTAQQQFEASEADKQRVWQAQQNEKDRATSLSSASIGASSRGGGGGGEKDTAGIVGGITSYLQGLVGKDGKVNPKTFQNARNQWVAAGGSAGEFNETYIGYANNKHLDDYM